VTSLLNCDVPVTPSVPPIEVFPAAVTFPVDVTVKLLVVGPVIPTTKLALRTSVAPFDV